MSDKTLVPKKYREELPTKAKDTALREAFAKAYVETRDPIQAARVVGYGGAFAENWAEVFMNEVFVIRLIMELEREVSQSHESRQARYRAWLEKEATLKGHKSSHHARVAALGILTKMDEDAKDAGAASGVMVVPEMPDPETWGQLAEDSQKTLKETVKE